MRPDFDYIINGQTKFIDECISDVEKFSEDYIFDRNSNLTPVLASKLERLKVSIEHLDNMVNQKYYPWLSDDKDKLRKLSLVYTNVETDLGKLLENFHLNICKKHISQHYMDIFVQHINAFDNDNFDLDHIGTSPWYKTNMIHCLKIVLKLILNIFEDDESRKCELHDEIYPPADCNTELLKIIQTIDGMSEQLAITSHVHKISKGTKLNKETNKEKKKEINRITYRALNELPFEIYYLFSRLEDVYKPFPHSRDQGLFDRYCVELGFKTEQLFESIGNHYGIYSRDKWIPKVIRLFKDKYFKQYPHPINNLWLKNVDLEVANFFIEWLKKIRISMLRKVFSKKIKKRAY